ncbi:MAG TPA: hypothetical protein PK385_00440 [Spirochaetota bacterium]|nr:MAG: hypothetical protein BWX91_00638 [Spirochaetes bacterium ADurb.Bin133]HNZ26572.1 hypothetical protein [Spirochaetota bacterium]HOF01159.1 hypothetical protein [Spirochaetota bacterium]HOS33153.1 hypothetical protein [Spirochaetota bacterium]HOS54505.1 hypothetical protein [Spirochaetota bacterium]
MFLRYLNEKEQKYFLELAYLIANCDNDFIDEEKIMIEQYRDEMMLSELEYKIQGKDLDEIVDFFKNASDIKKNYIIFEALGIIYSDNKFADEEKEVLNRLKAAFKINDKKIDVMVKKLLELKKIYNDLMKIFDETEAENI